MTERVGVRDLKASLSVYLRRVSAGDVPESLSRLMRSGRLNWAGRRLTVPPRRPALRGKGLSLADIVLRDRR